MRPYFARLCAQRGSKLAVVAVSPSPLPHPLRIAARRPGFDVAKLAIDEGPFRRTAVERYPLTRAATIRG